MNDGSYGYPVNNDINNNDDWKKILLEIVQGFEAGKKLDEDEYVEWHKDNRTGKTRIYINKKREEAYRKKFNHGMELFHKHFFSLWD